MRQSVATMSSAYKELHTEPEALGDKHCYALLAQRLACGEAHSLAVC